MSDESYRSGGAPDEVPRELPASGRNDAPGRAMFDAARMSDAGMMSDPGTATDPSMASDPMAVRDGGGRAPGSGPAGEVYDWYTRGMALLGHGDANAAVQLLAHAVAAEPASPSVREALGRAQFSAGQYDAARETFAWIVDRHPTDDYAQFGLGLSARKIGDLRSAVEHLALAVAMRPDIRHYGVALRGARAALNRA